MRTAIEVGCWLVPQCLRSAMHVAASGRMNRASACREPACPYKRPGRIDSLCVHIDAMRSLPDMLQSQVVWLRVHCSEYFTVANISVSRRIPWQRGSRRHMLLQVNRKPNQHGTTENAATRPVSVARRSDAWDIAVIPICTARRGAKQQHSAPLGEELPARTIYKESLVVAVIAMARRRDVHVPLPHAARSTQGGGWSHKIDWQRCKTRRKQYSTLSEDR